MADHTATFYAVVQATYGTWGSYKEKIDHIKVVRVTQGKPEKLGKNEVAVKLNLEMPDAAFKPFSAAATVTVPASHAQHPIHVITEQP